MKIHNLFLLIAVLAVGSAFLFQCTQERPELEDVLVCDEVVKMVHPRKATSFIGFRSEGLYIARSGGVTVKTYQSIPGEVCEVITQPK